ncbi:ABC transporter permease [Timonella sp. A28]|uniref:ABC transporter permease n=1 Tax=Timonella sp. A28 TaxID=3442640 RepID=UPI003EC08F6A
MTGVKVAHTPDTSVSGKRSNESTFAGTAGLLRLIARRDRFRTTAWILGVGTMGFYFANAIKLVAPNQEELVSLTVMFADPIGRMMTGPGYGMDAPTHERFYSAGYVLFLYILIALMSIFTVIRHTRADEQAGRAELLRANIVGRHAALTAALIVTAVANVVAGVLVFGGSQAAGYAVTGSVLVAVGGVATGLFFAGLAAVTAQLTSSSRSASGLAGAILGIAYLVRMGGDMSEPGGSTLSWFSPLAWAQQTAPYVLDRAWPLLLPTIGFVALSGLGYWLSTQRDFNAGLLPPRLGRATAAPYLGTPLGHAWRIVRGTLRGWGLALVLTGFMYGAFSQAMIDTADSLPPEFSKLFAGHDFLLGYFAYMAVFMAIFVAATAVSGLSRIRSEEESGRAEYGLSTPIGRTRWLTAHITIISVGVLLILAGTGVAMGLSATASLKEPVDGVMNDLILASVHQLPAVLAIMGIVVALYGWLPRASIATGWILVGFAGAVSSFGQLLDLPQAVLNLNILGHLSAYPVEPVDWTPVLWLTGIGCVGIALGLVGWSRRELNRA